MAGREHVDQIPEVRSPGRRRLVGLGALVGYGLLRGGAGEAAAWPRPRTLASPAERVVVLLDGLNSSSLRQDGRAAPDNHTVRIDFARTISALSRLDPPPRLAYFSYGAASRLARGGDPRGAWLNGAYEDAGEPVYDRSDTYSLPVADHARALDWLVRDLLERHPGRTLDLIGYSLGGIVALTWAAGTAVEPGEALASVHRVVLLDCPVGGVGELAVSPAMLELARLGGLDLGDGTVLNDLVVGSPTLAALPGALERVDVASVENACDPIVNGSVADGAFTSGFLPPEDTYYADLGGCDWPASRIVDMHRLILIGASPALDRARGWMVGLLESDGPVWERRNTTASVRL